MEAELAPTEPLPKDTVKTRVLELHRMDFAQVRVGQKTEVRFWHGGVIRLAQSLRPPELVVGYVQTRGVRRRNTCLLVVEDHWFEPLGAISADSLEREGFADRNAFRAYWSDRQANRGSKLSWRPLTRVLVVRLRPFMPHEADDFARQTLHRLYGPWL